MEPQVICEICNSLLSNNQGHCSNCEAEIRHGEASPLSLYNLDANLEILSERLTNLFQAIQDLTTQVNNNDQQKMNSATESMIKHLKWIESYGTDCSICLNFIQGISREMPCGHTYHNGCLLNWLKKQKTCPQCRCELFDDDL